MRHRGTVCVALVAVAAALLFTLVEYGDVTITTTYRGHSVNVNRSRPDDPLLGNWSYAHASSIAFAYGEGFYARPGVPHEVAAIGGLLVPYLLLCAALVLALSALKGRPRIVVAGLMVLLGLPPVLLFIYGAVRAMRENNVPVAALVRELHSDIVGMIMLIALTMLIVGCWLFPRARCAARKI